MRLTVMLHGEKTGVERSRKREQEENGIRLRFDV